MPAAGNGGPSIAASALRGRTPPPWHPTPEEDGSLALPPEQRGLIHRALADDEGADGRWMDVPHPGEVWGGAVGLTQAMVACLLLPVSSLHSDGPPGAQHAGRAAGVRAGEEPEGTEMEEKAPGVRVITDDSADADAFGAVAKRAAARPAAASAAADEDAFSPDCLTVPPSPGCLPGAPVDRGVKTRASVRSKPLYSRETLDEDDGALPTPLECFADVRVFTEQAATFMCPLHLFLPDGAEGQGGAAPPAVCVVTAERAAAPQEAAPAAHAAEPAAAHAQQASEAPTTGAPAPGAAEEPPPREDDAALSA
jgi:hypothetical protein